MQHGPPTNLLPVWIALALLTGLMGEQASAMTGEGRPSVEVGDCEQKTAEVRDPPEAERAQEAAVPPDPQDEEILLEHLIAALQGKRGEAGRQSVTALWHYAANHGVPEAALAALQEAIGDPEPAISQQAERALADLHRLQDRHEHPMADAPDEAEVWIDVASRAVEEPDDTVRAAAVGEVAWRRSAAAVEVLTEVAQYDLVPDIRYRALQSLWYSAADGLDPDGRIQYVLEGAVFDPDPRVVELAERALEDLKKLR